MPNVKVCLFEQKPCWLSDTENDCVTRAISLATGLPYKEVRKKLYHVSKLYNCPKLTLCCYRHLLDDIFKLPRVYCDGLTVGDFADLYPQGVYLVRMGGHISVIWNNVCYDIFDCRNMWLTDAWLVP